MSHPNFTVLFNTDFCQGSWDRTKFSQQSMSGWSGSASMTLNTRPTSFLSSDPWEGHPTPNDGQFHRMSRAFGELISHIISSISLFETPQHIL